MKNEVVNLCVEGEQTSITFEFKKQINFDKVASRGLKCECPEFIVPMHFSESGEIIRVCYSVDANDIKIGDVEGKLSIEKVLELYSSFLENMEKCREWYLKPEGFCYNIDYIYLDKKLETFKMLYIPDKTRKLEENEIKLIFMSLLEKCPEHSGSTIQLQLYKYFYRPQFDVEQFTQMLQEIQQNLHKHKEIISNDENRPVVKEKETEIEQSVVKEDNVIKEDKEVTKQEEIYKPTYTPRNRAQLSQEEIEEMVKSIYSGKSVESNKAEDVPKQEESSFYSTKKEGANEEKSKDVKTEPTSSLYSRKTVGESKKEVEKKEIEQEGKKLSGHKRSLFETVFSGNKNNKSVAPSEPEVKGVHLQSISSPARYDLPKEISLVFNDDIFIIGRKSREVHDEVADYEFGVEVTPISRMHAKFEKKAEGYYLIDLGSSNGTFINGTKIEAQQPYLIKEGDKIAFAIAFSKNSIEYEFHE